MKKTGLLNDMNDMQMLPLVIKMSLPAVCANIVNALYNFADRFFVGQYIGTDALGGVGLVFPLNNITSALIIMLSIGGSTLMSSSLGESNKEKTDVAFSNMMILGLGFAIVISFLCGTFTSSCIKLCGGVPGTELFIQAHSYLKITSIGMFFIIVNLTMAAAIRSEGNTSYAMVVTATGAILNIIIDYIMIVVLHYGIKGAALSTVISQIISCSLGFLYFLQGKSVITWSGITSLSFSVMKRVVTLGIAPAIFQGLNFVKNILINHSLMTYGNLQLGNGGGERAIAAVSIITSMENLAIMFIMGMNNALSVIISYNHGRKNFRRVRMASLTGQVIASSVTLILWFIMMFFPEQIFLLFNSRDTELASYGVRAVREGKIFLFGLGFQTLASMYYSAIGNPKRATFISISRNGLFLIPALLILPLFFKLDGVLLSTSVSDGLSLVLVSALYVKGMKESKRREISC